MQGADLGEAQRPNEGEAGWRRIGVGEVEVPRGAQVRQRPPTQLHRRPKVAVRGVEHVVDQQRRTRHSGRVAEHAGESCQVADHGAPPIAGDPAPRARRHGVGVGAVEERRECRTIVPKEQRLDLVAVREAVAAFDREGHHALLSRQTSSRPRAAWATTSCGAPATPRRARESPRRRTGRAAPAGTAHAPAAQASGAGRLRTRRRPIPQNREERVREQRSGRCG